jgi:hypothetical protein
MRKIVMPLAGFEPATPTSDRQQAHASDRAAGGIARDIFMFQKQD